MAEYRTIPDLPISVAYLDYKRTTFITTPTGEDIIEFLIVYTFLVSVYLAAYKCVPTSCYFS